jgi:DNA-binding NarL/FixJ family response regulator
MPHPSKTFAASLNSQGDEIFRDAQWKERAKHWVILVDDEESIRHAVGDFLFDQGYQVTACSDADTMFQVIFNKTGVPDSVRKSNVTNEELTVNIPAIPDIIISDVRMPGKNGIQMTEIIRGNERLRRVPIVLLTAKALTQDRVEGYRAGADVYLPKPFSPEELLSIIDGVILRRRQMAGERGKMADLAEELSYVKQLLQVDTGRYTPDKHIDSAPIDHHLLHRHFRLTPREQEVLQLLAMGYTNSEIATARGVSVVAINRTIQALYRKTNTHTRTELLRWGIQRGQLPNP